MCNDWCRLFQWTGVYLSMILAYPKTINIHTLQKLTSHSAAIFVTILVDQRSIQFHLDCGASCSDDDNSNSEKQNIRLEKCAQVLAMCPKTIIRSVGKCQLSVRNPQNKRCYCLEFIICNNRVLPAAEERKQSLWTLSSLTKQGMEGKRATWS